MGSEIDTSNLERGEWLYVTSPLAERFPADQLFEVEHLKWRFSVLTRDGVDELHAAREEEIRQLAAPNSVLTQDSIGMLREKYGGRIHELNACPLYRRGEVPKREVNFSGAYHSPDYPPRGIGEQPQGAEEAV